MKLTWDKVGERLYETGVDRGVLYLPNAGGVYDEGVSWNGLVTVTESPEGAESSPQYADNIKYLNLVSAEQFGGTIEAFTYPPEFAQCDGSAVPVAGVALGQQGRRMFGLSYRTRIGNDLDGTDHGYKLHLIYGAQAAPSEKGYSSINDSPEAITFSWAISTTPVPVGTIGGTEYKPTATMTIDSTKVDAAQLSTLEDALWGTAGQEPRLPSPAEVVAMFTGGGATPVTAAAPTYNNATHTITIPATANVIYSINGVDKAAGPVVITEDTVVRARAATGYVLSAASDDDWVFDYS